MQGVCVDAREKGSTTPIKNPTCMYMLLQNTQLFSWPRTPSWQYYTNHLRSLPSFHDSHVLVLHNALFTMVAAILQRVCAVDQSQCGQVVGDGGLSLLVSGYVDLFGLHLSSHGTPGYFFVCVGRYREQDAATR